MLNKNIVEGKWKEIKGEILKKWGQLTSDEVDQAKGDMMSLAGTLQKKAGLTQEEARHGLNQVIEKFGSADQAETDAAATNSVRDTSRH